MITTDAIGAKYDALLDRDSAEEILKAKGDEAAAAAAAAKADSEAQKAAAAQARLDAAAAKEAARAKLAEDRLAAQQMREEERQRSARPSARRRAPRARRPSRAMTDKMMQSAGALDRQLGRPPDRQSVAARDFRRTDPWPLMRPASMSRRSRPNGATRCFAKDEDALRRLIHPQFKLVGIRSTGSVAVDLEQWLAALRRMDIAASRCASPIASRSTMSSSPRSMRSGRSATSASRSTSACC